jgi:DNA polymerase-3 subunit delta
MQIKPADLPAHLARGPLAPIYVIHGDEPLVVLEAAQAIRDAARAAGFSEREVLTVEPGFSWSALTEAGQALSLFATQRLVELRIPAGRPGTEGGEALQAYAALAPADILLLVQLPKLEKAQQQSKWLAALADAGVVIACSPVGREALPAWIAGRLAQQGQRLAPEAMALLVARLEGNLLAAKQEIDKLGLLLPAGEITLEQLQTTVASVARYDVWGLGEALVAGDAGRYARMLDGLRAEGEAPYLVLWALADEIRALLRVGSGRQRGANMQQLLRENRVWGDKQKYYAQALERLRAPQLRAALRHAAEIDRLIKGLEDGDVWEALLALGLRLMPAPMPRTRI